MTDAQGQVTTLIAILRAARRRLSSDEPLEPIDRAILLVLLATAAAMVGWPSQQEPPPLLGRFGELACEIWRRRSWFVAR